MSKANRTAQSLVVILMFFSTLAMAQASGNNAGTDKSAEHHSRFSKVAFWRHHKDADKNTKQAQATAAPAKQTQAKTAQVKPASAKQPSATKDQKQAQHANHVSKPAAKKTTAAVKTKSAPKTQDPKPATLVKQ